MDANTGILHQIRQAAAVKVLFLPHAVQQMSRPERMSSPAEVRRVVDTGEVIEDYPEDARGHSCLLLGHGTNSRPLHVVCAHLAIITAYLPSSAQWEADWRTRKSV
jgi:hypothetical protein